MSRSLSRRISRVGESSDLPDELARITQVADGLSKLHRFVLIHMRPIEEDVFENNVLRRIEGPGREVLVSILCLTELIALVGAQFPRTEAKRFQHASYRNAVPRGSLYFGEPLVDAGWCLNRLGNGFRWAWSYIPLAYIACLLPCFDHLDHNDCIWFRCGVSAAASQVVKPVHDTPSCNGHCGSFETNDTMLSAFFTKGDFPVLEETSDGGFRLIAARSSSSFIAVSHVW